MSGAAALSPAEWRARGALLPWRGEQIFHCSEGRGEALLLLHGFPTSSWDWRHLWSELSREARVIAFDYVGYGFSSKPRGGPYSIFSYADEAEAVLQHAGVSTVHLLAHDLGDTVAQELLARDRERRMGSRPGAVAVGSVCLLNGGVFPELHRPRPLQRLLNSPLGPLFSRLLNQARFERAFKEVFGPETQPGPEELAGFWECMNWNQGTRNYHLLIRYMRERRQHRDRWVDALLDESIPLCFIDGLVDPVSGAHVLERLRELRPRATLHPLPGIGHYPQTEAPQLVLPAYRAFIGQQHKSKD